jgi:hypothetical protein
MRAHPTAVLSLAAITVLSLAAGCSAEPSDKDAPLQPRTLAEVTQQAQTDAKTMTDAAGTELINWAATPTPCVGRGGETADDDRWHLNAGGNLAVAPDQQLATLQRIRTALESRGLEITDDGVFANGTRGNLAARDPSSGHTMTLTTTMDLEYVAVSLDSSCYLPAAGENPLAG